MDISIKNLTIIIILLLIIIAVTIYYFKYYKENNMNINDESFLNSIKLLFKNDKPNSYNYYLDDDKYGEVKENNSIIYLSSSNIYKSHNDYQLGIFIKEEYKNHIQLSIIEYDLYLNPKKRVIYNGTNNQKFYDNYTVLNNCYFKIIFKTINNNKINFNLINLNDILDIILIEIDMNTNDISTLLSNNYNLNKNYFVYGSSCNEFIDYNSSIERFRLLNNMVLPLYIDFENYYIMIKSKSVNTIVLFEFDENFKYLRHNNADCNWMSFDAYNVNTKYITLLIKNPLYLNLDYITKDFFIQNLEFELKEKMII